MVTINHLLRVTACLDLAGRISLHSTRHVIRQQSEKTVEIALLPNDDDSPRWRLRRALVNGECLDSVTLYSYPHSPTLWESEFCQREGVEHLPVQGTYLMGVSAWSTDDQEDPQRLRLQKIIAEWAAYQAMFFQEAAARTRAALPVEKKSVTEVLSAVPKEKGVIGISGELLRRPL